METGMITSQNSYKIFNFTLTVSSTAAMLSATGDHHCGQPLSAVPLIELVAHNFCRKSLEVYHLNFCYGIP